jgi:RNA polymerase primary sigma factor
MRLRTDKVEDALIAMQDPVSLSSPIGSDGEDDLENLIPDTGAPPPEGRAEAFFRRVQVENWISTLSPREADILRMRYGIGRESSLSLNQVGRIFHVTRERARQIQAGALRKLRDSPRFTVMRDYLH